MKKSINPQAIQIQKRFFQALEICINSGTIKGGLKGFCEEHSLNRVKYQRIKALLRKGDKLSLLAADIILSGKRAEAKDQISQKLGA